MSCLNKRNFSYEKSISIKQLWLEIIEHHFFSNISGQSSFIEINLSYKMFFCWGTKKMLYNQNWWTIPLMNQKLTVHFLHKKYFHLVFTILLQFKCRDMGAIHWKLESQHMIELSNRFWASYAYLFLLRSTLRGSEIDKYSALFRLKSITA